MSDQEIDRDDPRFNQGVLHTVDLLAKALNAKDWVAGDGSEDYDEDLQQTLINILAAAGLYDTETGDYASETRDRLAALIARPYVGAWLDEILIEAAHQRDRWGADQDHGKAPADWFWLVGYLAGKALAAHVAGDVAKAHHHTVSTAAVLAHWAAAISGAENVMRPGVGADKIAGVDR
jgi:hypothetical protein